jgi:1,4-dihydroxy-2-naphthoate octaprenyltransferase
VKQLLARDERELGVDRAGDRLAYLVLSYGLLVVVAYRSFVERQTSWELLALVIVGGLVGTAYRLWHRTFTREAALVIGVTVLFAVAVGVLVALGIRS